MEARSDPPSPSSATGSPAPWAETTDAVLAALGVDARGLDAQEAEQRRQRFGPNEIEEARRASVIRIALSQFTSPLVLLLVIAAIVALAFREYVDSLVIAAALLIRAVIGFHQEFQAERSMAALQRLARSRARVIRAGGETEIDARELVPGDLILFEAGTKVPADARLLHATSLEVDESILTGESVPVEKRTAPVAEDAQVADRLCMVFQGTIVTRGTARAVVTATGAHAELGQIAGSMREVVKVDTPLQRLMGRFARLVALAVLISIAIGFVAGIALGEPFDELTLALIALAVAAIPEGLPIVFTVALAISLRRMAARGAIIRRLAAVETLGSCTAIGSDKTGTLTQNQMTVQAVVVAGRRYDVSGSGLERQGAFSRDGAPVEVREEDGLRTALLASVLCNEAQAVPEVDVFDAVGDPTEVALLVAAGKGGLYRDEVGETYPRFAEIPFDSDLRYMATFNRDDGDAAAVYVKGAPEEILAMCERDAGGGGLDTDRILTEAEELAGEGMRVLATATRSVTADGVLIEAPHTHLEGLTFLGLHGMIDPPRESAIAAVAACQHAGVRVLMITGDHAKTATAIARRLGIATEDEHALTGRDLEALDPAAFDAAVASTPVFARVSPQDKLAIVESLQRGGQTVAVTGDGVNDAPALRAADIGVAMGVSGTDVAKEAADMVVTDDDFASIVAAVEEGRVAFDNVRKTTAFLIATGAAAIIAVLASIFGRFDAPFIAAQMIWLNVVTNGVQDVALAFEPGEKDVLDRKPRPRSEGIISPLLWERTVIAGIVMAIGTLALFLYDLRVTGDLERARTVALTTMVLFQFFHVGNSRSEYRSVFGKTPWSNRFLFVGSALALGIHIGALHWGPTQFILRVEPLSFDTWVQMVLVASSVLVAVELHKLVRRRPRPTR